MLNKRIKIASILLIIFSGSFFRLINLNNFPPSLNWDEISHGYNAYSVLKTGNDEWGYNLPGIFRAFGDYKLPVYIYSLIPFISIFGLNEWVVRLPSAVAGISIIFGSYLFTKLYLHNVLKNKIEIISLLVCFLVAFNPWLFFLSRVAVEANLAMALFVWGMIFLEIGRLQFVENKKFANGLLIGSILLGLTLFTYNSYRIFTPLIFFSFVYIHWSNWQVYLPKFLVIFFPKSEIESKPSCSCHIVAFATFTIFLLLMLLQMTTPEGLARASNISILDQGLVNQINEGRSKSQLPSFLPLILHNKLTYGLLRIVQNYISYFNPNFWFFNGGTHYQFSLPNWSLVWSVEFITITIGILYCLLNSKKIKLILIWIIFAPLASSFTRDNPHTLRIITMAPLPSVISAIGLCVMVNYFWKSKLKILIWVLFLITVTSNFLLYFYDYISIYPKEYGWSWQFGNKQLAKYLNEVEKNYQQIYVTRKLGEPQIFLAFYQKWDPNDYSQNKVWEYRDANTSHAWYWINQYRKYIFYNDWEQNDVVCELGYKCLLISTSKPNDNWLIFDKVDSLVGTVVYYISKSK